VTVIGLLLGLVGICWITYALLRESRKEWALIPLGLTFYLVVTGIVVFEAFSSWILLSAITQRPIECAVGVVAFHLLIGVALWRSR
jgi:hypothetical protein